MASGMFSRGCEEHPGNEARSDSRGGRQDASGGTDPLVAFGTVGECRSSESDPASQSHLLEPRVEPHSGNIVSA